MSVPISLMCVQVASYVLSQSRNQNVETNIRRNIHLLLLMQLRWDRADLKLYHSIGSYFNR